MAQPVSLPNAKPAPKADTETPKAQGAGSTSRARRDGKVQVSFVISSKDRDALKVHGVLNGVTMQELFDEAMTLLFAQRDIERKP